MNRIYTYATSSRNRRYSASSKSSTVNGECILSTHEDSRLSSDPNNNQGEANQSTSVHLKESADVIENFMELGFNVNVSMRYITS